MKQVIASSKNPAAIGPYSQAIKVGGVCYTSGQLPFDPETKELEMEDLARATKLCMQSIFNICDELGVSKDNIVKCTILVADLKQYGVINETYGSLFEGNYPARTAFEVAGLPLGAPIEIEAIIDCEK
ncbi:Rid family detoxifying hydrolase [Mollicutes bacterium LVI A0039]|nr:Rid family detoxifying hydrolase [Mollicutes bacterium LVI A0039]